MAADCDQPKVMSAIGGRSNLVPGTKDKAKGLDFWKGKKLFSIAIGESVLCLMQDSHFFRDAQKQFSRPKIYPRLSSALNF